MFVDNFELIIASDCDRDELSCEVHYEDEVIAEVTCENNKCLIRLYPSSSKRWLELNYDTFIKAITQAKKHLLEE